MITVLLFAGLKEAIGLAQLEVEGAPLKVSELLLRLQATYPTASLQSVMVAINEQFVSREQTIVDGDVVALLPPVSGG